MIDRLRQLLAICLLCAPSAAVFADFGDYLDHRIDGDDLIVDSTAGTLTLRALNFGTFAVHYQEPSVKQLPSFAISEHAGSVLPVLSETDDALRVAVGELQAIVNKSPLRLSFVSGDDEIIAEEHGYFAYETVRGFRFQLDDDEKILGGGQRVLGMDRRGQRMPLYNKAHYGYNGESSQMYYSLPAILSSKRYIVAFDNTANGWLDIAHTEDNILQFEAAAGRTAYIVSAGHDYPSLLANFTQATGRQPLPPRWALGNFASRFGYRTEEQTRDVVRRFRDDDIPLDAVILDLYWFGPDIKGHMGRLDWDREAFPNPEAMISDFADDGVKTIVITEPFVLSSSDRWEDAVNAGALAKNAPGKPKTFDFYFGNTGLIDVFDEAARNWFWRPYEMLFEQGTAGTWGDLGEPEVHPGDALHTLSETGQQVTADEIHNAYGHRWAQMVYEKQLEAYPDMRPMIMMRSGFIGSQRYGMIPWTGDVDRSWGGLKPQVELSLQMGLLGLAYNHSDLGGFAGGTTFDAELYTRWLQYGVFQPVFRPHAQEHIAPEPVFHDRRTKRLARDAIRLRYRMLPYNYTLAWQNTMTGMPLMRPLFFEDESDTSLIDRSDAYLWGDAFLVAPLTESGVRSVELDLPAGTWIDFHDGTRYDGSNRVVLHTDNDRIPVLVRAGSFVPLAEVFDSTDAYTSEELELNYYADASVTSAQGEMYEDNGSAQGALTNGEYELLKFAAQQQGNSLSLQLRRTGNGYDGMPESRTMTLKVHNWGESKNRVKIDGTEIPLTRRLPEHGTAAAIDNGVLTLRFDWRDPTIRIDINPADPTASKPVVYQVFTRLFGNKLDNNVPWGTIEQNGVGKFADFNDAALAAIRNMGVSHIWYTGVPHHAVIRDYRHIGIANDDPDVVKGRAGSPYAVKDYYSVNPDLAVDPSRRLQEFESLIERTHAHGLNVIIDIVPNHVARAYDSRTRPEGVENLGANDDTSVSWRRDNDYYYIPDEAFRVPASPPDYSPLGAATHPLEDGRFDEAPAKWTGNGAREPQPGFHDWYETVKINYGVRPDGSLAFDRLPAEAVDWEIDEHAAFWRHRDVPPSWKKFRDIVLYWTAKGVDGFRYDMAEMVPVEFWSYLNSAIKAENPDAFLLAEVYNPDLYRDYIGLGRMDYLYDKVGFYDTLRRVMRGEQPAGDLSDIHDAVLDIDEHMLHFLENHDEQRIASPEFAGSAEKGRPAMAVSALIGRGPAMLYFGQHLGVAGDGDAGFGTSSRTTIFDYWGIPAQQRWMNGGEFDGGALSDDEKALHDFYVRLLNISADNPAMQGNYRPLDVTSSASGETDDRVFAFTRWQDDERLVVAANFDDSGTREVRVDVPLDVIESMGLADGRYVLQELLYGNDAWQLIVDDGIGQVLLRLEALESVVLRIGKMNIVRHANFASAHVGQRHIDVWLPSGYYDSDEAMQVIYAHDGQNLFNPSFVWNNEDWDVDGVLQKLIDDGEARNTIVVGIWNTPLRRREYLPADMFDVVSRDAQDTITEVMGGDPLSDAYLTFIVEELKPFIDSEYRTLPDRKHTFMMGSSMGGLISLYALLEYPDVFSAAACLSTHWPLSLATNDLDSTRAFSSYLKSAIPTPGKHRFYFDFGTEELDGQYEPHQTLIDALFRDAGYDKDSLYQSLKFEGAGHSEPWWRQRLDIPLKFLLGDT